MAGGIFYQDFAAARSFVANLDPRQQELCQLYCRRGGKYKVMNVAVCGLEIRAQRLCGMKSHLPVPLYQPEEHPALAEVDLAGHDGFRRNFVACSGNNRAQAQHVACFDNFYNQYFSSARSGRKFDSSRTENKSASWHLPLDKENGIAGIGAYVARRIERLQDSHGKSTEPMALAQLARYTILAHLQPIWGGIHHHRLQVFYFNVAITNPARL